MSLPLSGVDVERNLVVAVGPLALINDGLSSQRVFNYLGLLLQLFPCIGFDRTSARLAISQ